MSDLIEIQEEARPCFDPECDGLAEPELDANLRYFECTECGFQFGYERVIVGEDGSCSLGVPEGTRKKASMFAERAMQQEEQKKHLPLIVLESRNENP